MSEWNRSTDDPNGGLDTLLAQLRQQNSSSSSNAPSSSFLAQIASQPNPYFGQPQQQPQSFHQPTVSSSIPTPPVPNQPPGRSSTVISPTGEIPQQQRLTATASSGGASTVDRTANLLNLLKFSQPASSSSSQPTPVTLPQISPREHNLGPVGANSHGTPDLSDLLATLMSTSHAKENTQPSPHIQLASKHIAPSSNGADSAPSADTQAYLLQLLNRPKPAQTDAKPLLEASKPLTPSNTTSPQAEVADLTEAFQDASLRNSPEHQPDLHSSAPKVTQGRFTYVNPFDQLAASSPRNRTPKSSTPTRSTSGTPAMQILKPPRHAAAESSELKRKVDERDPVFSPPHSKIKLTSSPPPPSPLPDGQSNIEAPMGIGAAGKRKETVTEALSGVGDQVDKQVEEALARAEEDESQAIIERDIRNMVNARTEEEFEITAQVAAMSIKKELDKEGNEHILEDSLPGPVAEAVKHLVDDAAHGHIADSWESADAEESPVKDSPEPSIKVYNFPMKPFVSITLHPAVDPERPEFRPDGLMDVARLKKEFDQIDRTLVTSSPNFIAYGMSKNGGIRVIRQIDGRDIKLFTETQDRVFNVSLSSNSNSATEHTETLIGTGISGTVYWATVRGRDGVDLVGHGDAVKHAFALPPIQAPGEDSSGGVLKTRARKSSCHPEFFAVGRGKSIHIIWPSVIMKQGYLRDGLERVVDTEKYLSHRSLKINTGKAGKDFTFSQDDTVIVSLDKAGRVKFWDVRTLTNNERGDELLYLSRGQIQPVEIKEPLLTLITTPVNEKSWPTSVLFVDKYRPYMKGGVLRYLIVGMKQNHTLQLWDLALQKPVQELHLPHEKESDAVCSVMYHALTGMIVVGHPTRNSIYFIHLSSPMYNLPRTVSQAEFAERLAAGDQSWPKPEATAVMSGIREYSLANKGLLRSLDILPNPPSANPDHEDPCLFELYAMHSKGVTCITIRNEDIGWNKENKVILAVNAEEEGLITVEPIKPIFASEFDSSTASAAKSSASRVTPKDSLSKEIGRKSLSSNGHTDSSRTPPASSSASLASRVTIKLASQQTPTINGGQESATSGTERADKKKKKKSALGRGDPESLPEASTTAAAHIQAPPRVPSPPQIDGSSEQPGGQDTAKNTLLVTSSTDLLSTSEKTSSSGVSRMSPGSTDTVIKSMEGDISTEVSRLLTASLDNLYRRFDDDKRTQAAVADAKQDAMLRLISSTLSDNVEKTLADIVNSNIKTTVLPVISDVTMKAVNDQLGTKVGAHLKSTLPKELQSVLPDVITRTLQKPEVLKLISDSLVNSVAFRVEEQFANVLHKSVTPAFTALAVQAAQKAGGDVQRQAIEVIDNLERERRTDSTKIEQLSMLVTGLSETVSAMAAAQSKFQEEFLKLHRQATLDRRAANARSNEAEGSRSGTAVGSQQPSQAMVPAKTEEQLQLEDMLENITLALNSGNIETAIIRWVSSQREQEIFDTYFSQYDPSFIRGINPLMLLSIGSIVSTQLEGNHLLERLGWLETVLQSFQAVLPIIDNEVQEVTPKIMQHLTTRLEHLFMRVSNQSAQDPLLKRLSILVTTANRIVDTTRSFAPHGSSFPVMR